MGVCGSLCVKRSFVRTCPHCGGEMDEDAMMTHARVCYSSSSRATTDEFHSEYRGPVKRMNGAMKQLEDDYQKNSSKFGR